MSQEGKLPIFFVHCAMAIALEKLQDQLNCSICLETYTNPKQLQCHHVYCQQCLDRLARQDQQGQLSLTCPNCRQVTPVPASGVAGLQAAFQVNKLLDIVEEHSVNVVVANPEKTVLTSEKQTQQKSICSEHDGKEMELYCITCEGAICWECAIRGGKHHSHNYEKLKEAFTKCKKELESELMNTKWILSQYDKHHARILENQVAVEADVNNTITQIEKALAIRKTQLISQLNKLTEDKLKSLAAEKDKIKQFQDNIKENLNIVNWGEALACIRKNDIVKKANELTLTFRRSFSPGTKADMMFSRTNIAALCQTYGTVTAPSLPDPSKCYGNLKTAVTVGKKSIAVVEAVNFKGEPISRPTLTSIACELISEITGTRSRGSVFAGGKVSQCEISFQPTIKGRHQLHIKIAGQNIGGSPLPVFASSSIEMIGSPILTIGNVREPMGVAISSKGRVIVTEWNKHCVTTFSPSGLKLGSFGPLDSGQQRFNNPCGIAVDTEGNIFVAEHGNHRIQKFTAQGRFLRAVGTEGHEPLQFHHPFGLAFSASHGRVYIGSDDGHIQILNLDLSYFKTFGTSGSGEGQFNNPRHITCDSKGRVYVADRDNNRIQVFTAEGEFLRIFSKCDGGSRELDMPYGVAVDSDGRVYVSEWGSHCVSVFTSEGQFVKSFSSMGDKPEHLLNPYGLAVDSGVVYVCDSDNNCIQLF